MEIKVEDLITNIGKYGARITKVNDSFIYYIDNYAKEDYTKISKLKLNNLDDEGNDDGYYIDDCNNWILI